MQCILPQSTFQNKSPALDLVLDLVVILVAELLAHVGRHKTTLGRLALGLLDDGSDRGRLGEEHLELFEGATHGLRV
jgi:hypothetical protein